MCVGVYDFIVYTAICHSKNETVLQTSCIYIKPEYMIMSMGFNKTVCYNLSFSFVFESVCRHDNDEPFLGATNIGFVIGR